VSDRPSSTPTILRFLAGQVGWIAHRPEAEEIFDELHHAVGLVEHAVDTAPSMVFLGPCEVCNRDMYARADAVEVECRPCALVYTAAGRQDAMLEKAKDRLENAADVAAYLTTYGEPVNAARIRQWKRRGRLDVRGEDGHGNPLYSVGDVLKLLRSAMSDTHDEAI
jgi:hypothetical protein